MDDDREIDVSTLTYREALDTSRSARKRGARLLAVWAANRAYSLSESAEACVALGKAFDGIGRHHIAQRLYEKSIQADPSYVSNRFAYMALAGLLRSSRELGNMQRARHIARRVLKDNPSDVVAQEFVAVIEADLRWRALPYSRSDRNVA